MSFTADTMFPGDLFDATARFAIDMNASATRQDAWRQAAAMGWPALLIGEARGGTGGSLSDLGAVIEACARQALGLPLVRRCAMAAVMLTHAANDAACDAANDTLRALAAGEVDLDVPDATALSVTPLPGGGVRLSGRLESVDAELPFTHLLVGAEDHLLLLPSSVLGAEAARHVGIDGRAVADMELRGLHVEADDVLLVGPEARRAIDAAHDAARLATAIEMAATLGATIEHCIAYLNTRVQFGVALSSFQVLRHKVVDLYVQYESASVLLARLVEDTVASGKLARRDAALCKLYLGVLARQGAESAIQLHGGMGMTAELPMARLARRLLCAEFEHGDRLQQLDTLRTLTPALAASAA